MLYQTKKTLYFDVNKLYGWAMSESLPYDGIEIDENTNIEDFWITPEDSDIGWSWLEKSWYYKGKAKYIPFCTENKKFIPDIITPYLDEKKTKYLYTK